MSIKIPPDKAKELVAVLQLITSETKVDALAVVSDAGERVAFFAQNKTIDPVELSAVAAALASTSKLAVDRLAFSPMQDIILRGSNGFMVLKDLGRFYLIGGSTDNQAMPTIVKSLSLHAPKISHIMADVHPY
ncbi:MAG: roadblock/LC7 domain-containing protein [Candidatus Heimdallarchaeota archaeon]|nr:roadblock/LC7 domain-containing protein [Candidatus Heimdallarchaeota archaeon]